MTLPPAKKLGVIVAMLGSTALLSGCGPDQAAPPISSQPVLNCVGSEVDQYLCRERGGGFSSTFSDTIFSIVPIGMIDFGAFYIDTIGSNVVYPSNGTFTITLKDNGGQTLAASSFSWAKQGNNLVASSPSTIQNWMLGVSGNYNTINAELDPMDITAQTGINAVMFTAHMGSDIIGATGTVWSLSSCNTGPQQGTMNCL